MPNMKKVALILLVAGFVLWSIAFLITINFDDNTILRELESFFGGNITAAQRSSVLNVANMLGIEIDFTTRIGIILYQNASTINTFGWLALVAGAVLYVVNRFTNPEDD